MAVLFAVWVPVVAVAHAVGLALFVYGFECSSGLLTKTSQGLRRHLPSLALRPQRLQKECVASETEGFAQKLGARVNETCSGASTPVLAQGNCKTFRCQPSDLGSIASIASTSAASEATSTSKDHLLQALEAGLLDTKHLKSQQRQELYVRQQVSLAWCGLGCSIRHDKTRQHKYLLRNCSGTAQPGEVHGILGPSGAGKSTLLECLAGRKSLGMLTGQVLCKPEVAHSSRTMAFVAQEDVFVPTFTADETLRFYARMLMHQTATQQLEESINEVLECMGLCKCRHTQVGGVLPGGIWVRGLSGGERRRLSIACALIARPSLVFLDEPTTGLDSFAALSIMNHLSHLAELGHTLLCTVHQPRAAIWATFSQITILSEGYTVYTGRLENVLDWFGELGYTYGASREALADWLIDTVSIGFQKPAGDKVALQGRSMTTPEDVQLAAERFSNVHTEALLTELLLPDSLSDAPDHDVEQGRRPFTSSSPYSVSTLSTGMCSLGQQVAVLLQRSLQSQMRHPYDAGARLMLSLWSGILPGLVCWNLPSGPSSVFQILSVVLNVVQTFELLPFCYMSFYCSDRRQYCLDVAANLYSPLAYHTSTCLAAIPSIGIGALVGAYASYAMCGMRDDGSAIVLHGLIQVLAALISAQLLVACIFFTTNQDMAYILATAYLSLSIMLSGVYMRKSDFKVPPADWLSYISLTRWTMMGLAQVEFAGRDYDPGFIVSGLPGTSKPVLDEAANNPTLAGQRLVGGFEPTLVSTGDEILRYWDYTTGVGPSIAILLGIYALFHLLSWYAMAKVHREKR